FPGVRDGILTFRPSGVVRFRREPRGFAALPGGARPAGWFLQGEADRDPRELGDPLDLDRLRDRDLADFGDLGRTRGGFPREVLESEGEVDVALAGGKDLVTGQEQPTDAGGHAGLLLELPDHCGL